MQHDTVKGYVTRLQRGPSAANACLGVAPTVVYILHIKVDIARGRMQFSGKPGKAIYCTLLLQ